MLCIYGQAKAFLNQIEEEQGNPRKYELKMQLNAVFDADAKGKARMALLSTAGKDLVKGIINSWLTFYSYTKLLTHKLYTTKSTKLLSASFCEGFLTLCREKYSIFSPTHI